MTGKVMLSLEQALTLPYATQRFVQLGWRVIRLEATAAPGQERPGDPNRYVGHPVAGPDRCSYFFPPNAGKEAISLNLKVPEGRELLGRLIRELPVDVFCCNTLPKRYEQLGIDEPTLRSYREDLIWVGISAMGPEFPDVPGYDPVLQGLLGYMHLTGERNGPPMLCGVPLVDLKGGDEAFAQICLALAERAETGRGKRIDVSMAQAAASWLVTFIPLLDLGGSLGQLSRNGNEHREFVPVNVYPTADGFVFLAVGNDLQWQRLVALEAFASLAREERQSNHGRQAHREAIHREVAALTRHQTTAELVSLWQGAGLAAAPINDVADVVELPMFRNKLPYVSLPEGPEVRLAPPGVDSSNDTGVGRQLPLPPHYGEHNAEVLGEIGLTDAEVEGLRQRGVVS
jgi:crotonobetainyl-CoA:carnitine CoA-transferase CaiB-like acyl-CoA transferase